MLKLGIVGNKEFTERLQLTVTDFTVIGYFDLSMKNNFLDNNDYAYLDFLSKTDAVLFMNTNHAESGQFIEKAIRLSKHILCNGFIKAQSNLIQKYISLSKEAGTKFQFYNVLRNTPTLITAYQYLNDVKFIKTSRKIPRQNKGIEYLIHNYLQHDIELAAYVFNSEVKRITPNVLQIFDKSPDVLSLLIEFNNDGKAEIKIQQYNDEEKHHVSFYQENKIIDAIVHEEEVYITKSVRKDNEPQLNLQLNYGPAKDTMSFQKIRKPVLRFDVVKKELSNFNENIENNITPIVNIHNTLDSYKIIAQVERILQKKCVY
jgi:hypothetical protein